MNLLNEHQQQHTLNADELRWLEDNRDGIEATNYSIQGLADMLIVIAEMADDSSIDPHFRTELCGTGGLMTIGYAIERLTEKITYHQEEIEGILNRTAMAEHKARMASTSVRIRRKFRQDEVTDARQAAEGVATDSTPRG